MVVVNNRNRSRSGRSAASRSRIAARVASSSRRTRREKPEDEPECDTQQPAGSAGDEPLDGRLRLPDGRGLDVQSADSHQQECPVARQRRADGVSEDEPRRAEPGGSEHWAGDEERREKDVRTEETDRRDTDPECRDGDERRRDRQPGGRRVGEEGRRESSLECELRAGVQSTHGSRRVSSLAGDGDTQLRESVARFLGSRGQRNLAVREDGDVVCRRQQPTEVVGDDDDSRLRRGQRPDVFEDGRPGGGVQPDERLVQQEVVRLHRQHPRERDTGTLTAGELDDTSSPRPSIPTVASAVSTRRSISARSSPRFSGPKATSAATVAATNWSRGFWKTTPTRVRTATGSVAGSWPSTDTLPVSAVSNPTNNRTSVDLPEPLGPASRRNWPSGIDSETPSSAGRPVSATSDEPPSGGASLDPRSA